MAGTKRGDTAMVRLGSKAPGISNNSFRARTKVQNNLEELLLGT